VRFGARDVAGAAIVAGAAVVDGVVSLATEALVPQAARVLRNARVHSGLRSAGRIERGEGEGAPPSASSSSAETQVGAWWLGWRSRWRWSFMAVLRIGLVVSSLLLRGLVTHRD
jgi:hypothetical protein